jgi:hypothetical protein
VFIDVRELAGERSGLRKFEMGWGQISETGFKLTLSLIGYPPNYSNAEKKFTIKGDIMLPVIGGAVAVVVLFGGLVTFLYAIIENKQKDG